MLLNPSLLTQSDFAAKSSTIWFSLYKVEKVLTKSDYLIVKIGTPCTQCLHRIRLRPIVPNYEVKDITITLQIFKPDPSLGESPPELELFDEALGNSVLTDIIDIHDFPMTKNNQTDEVHHTIRGVLTTPGTTEQPAPAGTAEPAAIIGGTDTVPRFPPLPVLASVNTARLDHETFSEPVSRTEPGTHHKLSAFYHDRAKHSYGT